MGLTTIAATFALTLLLDLQAAASGPTADQPPVQRPVQPATVASPESQDPQDPEGPQDPTAPSAPPPPLRPRLYGDAGTSEVAIGVGYSTSVGFLAAGGFRYFVLDGIAPGVEATYLSGGESYSAFGMVMGGLRVVPFRSGGFALVITGRAGRVFLADHPDGWGVGGGGGVIVFLGANVGLELGYEVLRLLPAGFCADLDSCVIARPVLGLRLSF